MQGRSPTCYSPVRRSCTPKGLTARLACVKHAASVRPEPGSNSPLKTLDLPRKGESEVSRTRVRKPSKKSRPENSRLKCPTLTRGVRNRNQIKYLALTFIDTLLSSQRTHAQAISRAVSPFDQLGNFSSLARTLQQNQIRWSGRTSVIIRRSSSNLVSQPLGAPGRCPCRSDLE